MSAAHLVRGRLVQAVACAEVKVGDRLCLWVSDADAYLAVTGWTDHTIDLTRHGLGIYPRRTFTVAAAPWWAEDMMTFDLDSRVQILAEP